MARKEKVMQVDMIILPTLLSKRKGPSLTPLDIRDNGIDIKTSTAALV